MRAVPICGAPGGCPPFAAACADALPSGPIVLGARSLSVLRVMRACLTAEGLRPQHKLYRTVSRKGRNELGGLQAAPGSHSPVTAGPATQAEVTG